MRVRKRVYVSGRVQGVFFRDSARTVASEAGVAGFATNLADGRVELVLEGDEDAVLEVISWAKNGPSHAHVEEVEVVDEAPQGLSGFRIS